MVLCGDTVCNCTKGLGRPILLESCDGIVDEAKGKVTIKSKLGITNNIDVYNGDVILGNAA